MKTAEVFITEKYEHNNWGFYPPSRRLVAEWMEDYAKHYHKEQLATNDGKDNEINEYKTE